MFATLPLYLCLGAVAGIIAGLLGVGGGLVIVPALSLLFRQQGIQSDIVMHLALGTSLATIIVTSISSVLSHHHHNAVLWSAYSKIVPGIITGTVTGAVMAYYIPKEALQSAFGVFEIAIAFNMLFGRKPSPRYENPAASVYIVSGFVIGNISAVLGIGGGTLVVPLLVFFSVSLPIAIGTAAACGLPIAIFGAAGYAVMGWRSVVLPYSLGYVYLPAFIGIVSASAMCAPLGARLAHNLSVNVLKKIFAFLLIALGVKMLMLPR